MDQSPRTDRAVEATAIFPNLSPENHGRHALHAADRTWPETNCYVDLLVEVLAARGLEPRAALGFTVSQDFEGDHFTFFKPPAADLTRLYGLEVIELSIFDDLEQHLAGQVRRGRLPIVEVDAFHLPDTRGVSYRVAHSKTTIGINRIDPCGRTVEYFHNTGLFRAEGVDFEALLSPFRPGLLPLFPYAEMIKFGAVPVESNQRAIAYDLLTTHLARRPERNPFRSWLERLPHDLAEIARRPEAWFHIYAFNVLRQAGANFGCLAAHLEWLAPGDETLAGSRSAADAIAQDLKVLQFQLARAAARKRIAVVDEAVRRVAEHYDQLIAGLLRWTAPQRNADLAA